MTDQKEQEKQQINLGNAKRTVKELSSAECFVEAMSAHSDDIRIDRITLNITKDLGTASVLTRLAYWFSPSRRSKKETKTTIFKDGKHWIAKKDEDWFEECGVSAKQMRRIKKELQELGCVKTETWKFYGNPTTHFNLNYEKYYELYMEEIQKNISNCTDGTKPNVPMVQKESDQRDKTSYYTQETTTEEYNNSAVVFPCLGKIEVSQSTKEWITKTYRDDEEAVKHAINVITAPGFKVSTTLDQALKWACKEQPEISKSPEQKTQDNKSFAQSMASKAKMPQGIRIEILNTYVEIGNGVHQPTVIEYKDSGFEQLMSHSVEKWGGKIIDKNP